MTEVDRTESIASPFPSNFNLPKNKTAPEPTPTAAQVRWLKCCQTHAALGQAVHPIFQPRSAGWELYPGKTRLCFQLEKTQRFIEKSCTERHQGSLEMSPYAPKQALPVCILLLASPHHQLLMTVLDMKKTTVQEVWRKCIRTEATFFSFLKQRYSPPSLICDLGLKPIAHFPHHSFCRQSCCATYSCFSSRTNFPMQTQVPGI